APRGCREAVFGGWRSPRGAATCYPGVRYVKGGWGAVIDRLAAYARRLGVRIETGTRVHTLPDTPTIVAVSLDAARTLLGDDGLRWESGRAVLLDLAVRRGEDDLFLLSDLDEGGFVEQYGMLDASLAPPGETLFQMMLPIR